MPLIAEARAGAHAVAAELLHVDLVPDADHVVGVHAHDELLERGVDQLRHGARAAPVMRLAPADDAASVVTFTMTASRFTARPMPSVTLFFGSTGNEVGKAWMSVMRRLLGRHRWFSSDSMLFGAALVLKTPPPAAAQEIPPAAAPKSPACGGPLR